MVEIHWLVVDKGQSLAGLGVLEDDSFWPGRGFIPGGEDIQQSEVTAIEKPRVFTISGWILDHLPEISFGHGLPGETCGVKLFEKFQNGQHKSLHLVLQVTPEGDRGSERRGSYNETSPANGLQATR